MLLTRSAICDLAITGSDEDDSEKLGKRCCLVCSRKKKTPSTPNKSRTHDPGFREHRQQLTRHNVESMFLSIIFLKDITNFMISLFEPQGPTFQKTVLAPHVILGSYPFAKEKHRFLTVHLT